MAGKIRQYKRWTAQEDAKVFAPGMRVRDIARLLGRSEASIRQRRILLRHGRQQKVTAPQYVYSDPLNALFEPELPPDAHKAAVKWWHNHSPDFICDRDQAHLSFLSGYAAATNNE